MYGEELSTTNRDVSLTLPLDLSLIFDYTPEADRVAREVVVTRFKKEDKSLLYVNAHHVTGIDNPTCKAVQRAIKSYKPQLVIVEGLLTEHGPSPTFYIEYANRQSAQQFPNGEPGYAAHLAQKNGIPFIGGEPSQPVFISSMKKEGYSTKEVMAFHLLQMIPQDRRESKPMDEVQFSKRSAHYLQQHFEHIPPEERLTIAEFRTCYTTNGNDGKHFLEISTEDFAPYASPVGNYFQQLNHKLGIVRERHLDTLIAESLSNNERVLVVYGDGHLVKSRAVFEKMLGPGKIVGLGNGEGAEGSNPSRPGSAVCIRQLTDTASPL